MFSWVFFVIAFIATFAIVSQAQLQRPQPFRYDDPRVLQAVQDAFQNYFKNLPLP